MEPPNSPPPDGGNQIRPILTVGHSNYAVEKLLGLLRQHRIDVLVDVRSQPYSRFASQFNREQLDWDVTKAGIRYLFLGEELGGRQLGKITSLDERLAIADEVAALPAFQRGIDRLVNGAGTHQIALLCAEEDPTECHRRLWVGRAVQGRGVMVNHIRGDGRIDSDDMLKRLAPPEGQQLELFGE